MLIPLGTDRPLRRPTRVTFALIGVCVGVYAVQTFLRATDPDQARRLVALGAVFGQTLKANPWTLLTSAFLHASPLHLAGNMLFLWVFGPNIEDRLGRPGYLAFYLLGAAASGALHASLADSPAIGASGAIAALTGAYLVLFPRTMIRVFSLIGVVGLIAVQAWWFIGLAIVWDLASHATGRASGIAHLAHLGGYAFGIAGALALLGTKLVPGEPYDLFSAGKQALRRREIRSAVKTQNRAVARAVGAAKTPGTPIDDPRTAELARARADVTSLVAAGDFEAAARAYRDLADRFADQPGATTLARKHQYDLANHLFAQHRHAEAAFAYERLIETYPRDAEAPQIKLMLGTIAGRYLNDPIRAKHLLADALKDLRDEASITLAQNELQALG